MRRTEVIPWIVPTRHRKRLLYDFSTDILGLKLYRRAYRVKKTKNKKKQAIPSRASDRNDRKAARHEVREPEHSRHSKKATGRENTANRNLLVMPTEYLRVPCDKFGIPKFYRFYTYTYPIVWIQGYGDPFMQWGSPAGWYIYGKNVTMPIPFGSPISIPPAAFSVQDFQLVRRDPEMLLAPVDKVFVVNILLHKHLQGTYVPNFIIGNEELDRSIHAATNQYQPHGRHQPHSNVVYSKAYNSYWMPMKYEIAFNNVTDLSLGYFVFLYGNRAYLSVLNLVECSFHREDLTFAYERPVPIVDVAEIQRKTILVHRDWEGGGSRKGRR